MSGRAKRFHAFSEALARRFPRTPFLQDPEVVAMFRMNDAERFGQRPLAQDAEERRVQERLRLSSCSCALCKAGSPEPSLAPVGPVEIQAAAAPALQELQCPSAAISATEVGHKPSTWRSRKSEALRLVEARTDVGATRTQAIREAAAQLEVSERSVWAWLSSLKTTGGRK